METTWLLAIAIIVYAILAAIIFKGMMIDVIELEKKKRQREIEGMREIGSRLDRDLEDEEDEKET